MFIEPNVDVYEGQIMGLHSRGNDLVVNPTKGKQLTNVRASGSDEAVILTPPVLHSLEQALEFIDEDELVEVTPKSIRLRKKLLLEHERKRASRQAAESPPARGQTKRFTMGSVNRRPYLHGEFVEPSALWKSSSACLCKEPSALLSISMWGILSSR
ncbi:MAG: hypothetical protein CM15mP74_15050 [Halieaceae bacterium]|nr:MAG: hypothetical protein CM15mP74_15050 [Halieaceae bacterium]